MRRNILSEKIIQIFDESKQGFSTDKICAVLEENQIKTSPKYDAELMHNMNLQSTSASAKRE